MFDIWYSTWRLKKNLSCCSSARDHETWPAIGYIFVQIDGVIPGISLSSLDERLFTTHTVLYSAHSSICSLYIQKLKLISAHLRMYYR